MKKKYTPPMLYVENLTLSHHIAACSGTIVKWHQADASQCGVEVVGTPDSFLTIGTKVFTLDGYCAKDSPDVYLGIDAYCYTNLDSNIGPFFGS